MQILIEMLQKNMAAQGTKPNLNPDTVTLDQLLTLRTKPKFDKAVSLNLAIEVAQGKENELKVLQALQECIFRCIRIAAEFDLPLEAAVTDFVFAKLRGKEPKTEALLKLYRNGKLSKSSGVADRMFKQINDVIQSDKPE